MTLALVIDQGKAEEWATWETFWSLWPKRVARLDASKAWQSLSSDQRVAAVTALPLWRQVWASRGEMQFVPYAATWLRGQRWEDEMPDRWTTSHASHTAAKLPSAGERAEMPQHVRDAIARLRK
jgi:hypothetical protein